jgi:hypothetical protein
MTVFLIDMFPILTYMPTLVQLLRDAFAIALRWEWVANRQEILQIDRLHVYITFSVGILNVGGSLTSCVNSLVSPLPQSPLRSYPRLILVS